MSKTCNSLRLIGSTGVNMTGAGALTLNSGGLICDTTAPGTISGGTLTAAGGELVINTATNLTVSSVLSASTALVKTGPAKLTLSSPVAISGNTFIDQGILEYAPTSNMTYAGSISGPGTLLQSSTNMLTLTGTTNAFTGTANVTAGTLAVNGLLGGSNTVSVTGAWLMGSGTIGGNVTVSGGTVAQASGGWITGSVSDTSGTLVVGQTSGSNNFLNALGGVTIGGSGSLVASSTAATIVGSLNYTSSATSNYSGCITGSGNSVTMNSTGLLALAGSNNTYTGGTVVNAGTLEITNSKALPSTGVLTVGSPRNVVLQTASGMTISELMTASPLVANGSLLQGQGGCIQAAPSASTIDNRVGNDDPSSPAGAIRRARQ